MMLHHLRTSIVLRNTDLIKTWTNSVTGMFLLLRFVHKLEHKHWLYNSYIRPTIANNADTKYVFYINIYMGMTLEYNFCSTLTAVWFILM